LCTRTPSFCCCHAKEAGTHTQDRQPHSAAARSKLCCFLGLGAPINSLLPQRVWHKCLMPFEVTCVFQQSVTPTHSARAAQWLSTHTQSGPQQSGMNTVHSRPSAAATVAVAAVAAAAVCDVPGHRALAQVSVCMSAVPRSLSHMLQLLLPSSCYPGTLTGHPCTCTCAAAAAAGEEYRHISQQSCRCDAYVPKAPLLVKHYWSVRTSTTGPAGPSCAQPPPSARLCCCCCCPITLTLLLVCCWCCCRRWCLTSPGSWSCCHHPLRPSPR
jgi:hypothetical protein